MGYYSRLARRNERVTKQQSTLLIIASVVILILFIVYGFPAILSLAGTVSRLRGSARPSSFMDTGTPPTAPRFSQDFEATKSATINVHGVADPNVTVEVFQNERSLGITKAADDGTFSAEADLSKGPNVFTAIATSDSGQKSEVSDSYIVTFFSAPPKLDVSSPKDGDSFKDSPTTISGSTDPGVLIMVNDRLAIVDSAGKFSYSLTLNNGDNKVKVVASDKAGNQTTKEITIKFNP